MQQFIESLDQMIGRSFRYCFLGQGSQYRVYALLSHDGIRTGRVIKIPLSLGEIECAIAPFVAVLDSSMDREHLARQKAQILLRSRQALPQIVEGINGGQAELMRAIGDTKVLPQAIPQLNSVTGEVFLPIIYTQQEVTPLSVFFDDFRSPETYPGRITTESIKKVHIVFQKICQLHVLLWRYGFFENSFNLRNMGYYINGDASPEIVLLDVGEMGMSLNEAQSRLAEQPWLYNMSQHKRDYQYLPPVLHRIFKEVCEQYFTHAVFERYWQNQKKNIEQYYSDQLMQQESLASDPEQQVYLWARRQNLATQLYQGMVDERLEQTFFNSADLRMLQDDIRAQTSSRDEKLEHAERISADRTWRPSQLG